MGGSNPRAAMSRRIALQDLLQRLPPLTVPAVRLIDCVNPCSVGCSDLRVGQCAVSRMSRISPVVGLFVPVVTRARVPFQSHPAPAGVAGWV